jgi:hypothetical protein
MNWVRFIVPALILFIVITTAVQLNKHFAEKPQNKSTLPEKTATIEKNHSSKKMRPKTTLAVGATYDNNGQLWLAKVENNHLLVYKSKDNGRSFTKPVVVTPEPENISADGENRPKIAVTHDGTVFLTWTQSLPKNYSGDIRFSRSTDSGKTFSKPITLNDDGQITSHRFDSLAIDNTGRVVIAWLDARDREAAREKGEEFTGISLSSAQSVDNGATFSANRTVQEHVCECCRISLAWTIDGPVVFWRNIFNTNTRDFAISRLDTGEKRRVTDDEWQVDSCPHHGGDMAVDSQDRLHLVWFTNGNTRQGLFYKNITGKKESSPLSIGNSEARAGHPSVSASGNTVLIAWRELDGSKISSQIMYSSDAGITWSDPKSLAKTSGVADYPVPMVNGEQMMVIWNTSAEGLRILPVNESSKLNNIAMR